MQAPSIGMFSFTFSSSICINNAYRKALGHFIIESCVKEKIDYMYIQSLLHFGKELKYKVPPADKIISFVSWKQEGSLS